MCTAFSIQFEQCRKCAQHSAFNLNNAENVHSTQPRRDWGIDFCSYSVSGGPYKKIISYINQITLYLMEKFVPKNFVFTELNSSIKLIWFDFFLPQWPVSNCFDYWNNY